jgi:hypothetical protein
VHPYGGRARGFLRGGSLVAAMDRLSGVFAKDFAPRCARWDESGPIPSLLSRSGAVTEMRFFRREPEPRARSSFPVSVGFPSECAGPAETGSPPPVALGLPCLFAREPGRTKPERNGRLLVLGLPRGGLGMCGTRCVMRIRQHATCQGCRLFEIRGSCSVAIRALSAAHGDRCDDA